MAAFIIQTIGNLDDSAFVQLREYIWVINSLEVVV
jgi:hypothetical protein